MKAFKGTWLLFAAIVLLVGYAIFDFKSEEKKTAQEAERQKIVQVASADISAVLVHRKNEILEMKKTDGRWAMVQPLADDVEAEAVQEYLDSIGMESGTTMPKPEKGVYNWADYYLAEPAASFELTKKDASKVTLKVSSRVAFDGSYYIRRGDELILGSTGWARIVEKGSNQLRDKRLWRQPTRVEKLTFELNGKDLKEKYKLIRKNDIWEIEGSNLAVDSQKVDRFVDGLKEIRGLEFASKDVLPATLKSFGFSQSTLRLTVEMPAGDGAQPPLVIELGDEKDGGVYAKTSAVPSVLRLSVSDAGKLRQSKSGFRDDKAPFKVEVEQIQQVRVKDPKGVQVFTKNGSEWKLEGGRPEQTVATEKFQKFFEKMGTLEAKEYYPSGQKVGAIRHTLEFRDGKGKALLAMEVADDFNPKVGRHQNEALTYVRLNTSKEVFAISNQDLKELSFDQLVNSGPATSEKK